MQDLRPDVLVVGGGPAGLAAACTAAKSGKKILLVDDNPNFGGQIWREQLGKGPAPQTQEWLRSMEAAGNVTLMPGTTVVHANSSTDLFARSTDGMVRIQPAAVVLAVGGQELFLPFPGWDLPNVMGCGGLQALVKTGFDVSGKRVALVGSGPLMLAVASHMKNMGAKVVCMAEQVGKGAVMKFGMGLVRYPSKLAQGAALKAKLVGIPQFYSMWPARAEGEGKVERLVLTNGKKERSLDVDIIACGFGLIPNVAMAHFFDCELKDGCVQVDANQQTSVANIYCAGESTGIGGVDVATMEGQVAGYAASGQAQQAQALHKKRDGELGFADGLNRTYALRPELKSMPTDDTVVCRCEDVKFGQVKLYSEVRDAKLKTRCGMGPCQGRICGGALRHLLGWERDKIRPPFFPLSIGEMGEVAASEDSADD